MLCGKNPKNPLTTFDLSRVNHLAVEVPLDRYALEVGEFYFGESSARYECMCIRYFTGFKKLTFVSKDEVPLNEMFQRMLVREFPPWYRFASGSQFGPPQWYDEKMLDNVELDIAAYPSNFLLPEILIRVQSI